MLSNFILETFGTLEFPLMTGGTQNVSRAVNAGAEDRRITAIYPGSFDPLTNGHLDLIARAASLFDHLIVAVLTNTQKQALFPVEERVAMLKEAVAPFGNVEAASFSGLLVDFAAARDASVILRGIRAVSDYESELQIAQINRRMRPTTETVFLLAREEFAFLSSRLVKEIVTLGGDVAQFVPEPVMRRLRAKSP